MGWDHRRRRAVTSGTVFEQALGWLLNATGVAIMNQYPKANLNVPSQIGLYNWVDAKLIDGAVNGVGNLIRGSATGLRHMQTGYVRTYAGWILLGGVALVVWFLR